MIKIISTKKITPIPFNELMEGEFSFFLNRNSLLKTITGFHVYINEYAWNAFINHGIHVYKQTNHEAQGIFIGKYFKDDFGEFAVATEYKEGYGESSRAYVGMTEECLIKISNECREKSLLMLIWVHTHPDLGVFYSGTDRNCIRNNFFMPYHCGIVVDIIRKEIKGYKVLNDVVNEFENYFLFDPKERKFFKPYENKATFTTEIPKKKENQKADEVPIQDFFSELQVIRKELAEFETVKNELSELRDLLSKKQDGIFETQQSQILEAHREYLQKEFSNILISQNNNEEEHTNALRTLLTEQTKIKKFLFWFLITVVFILCTCLAAMIFIIHNLFAVEPH